MEQEKVMVIVYPGLSSLDNMNAEELTKWKMAVESYLEVIRKKIRQKTY